MRNIKYNTIKELTVLYLAERKPFIKNTSYSHYWELANNYIYPHIGELTFSDFKNDALINYLECLKRSGKTSGSGGLSDKTIKDVMVLLKSIFNYAADNCYCPPNVVFPKTRCIQKTSPMILVLTKKDQSLLEEYVLNNLNLIQYGILLSLYTGMRIGEICALKWEDIDVDNSLISVNKTILRIKNVDAHRGNKVEPRTILTVNSPKSATSNRMIPIPMYITEITKTIMKQRQHFSKDYYVLSDSDKPIEPREYYKRYKRILVNCGINAKYTFHTLRHTFATRCVEQNIDPKIISELLGHSNVSITLNRYVHPTMKMKRDSVEKLFQR